MHSIGDIMAGIRPAPKAPRNAFRGQSEYIRDIAAVSTRLTRDERAALILRAKAFAKRTRKGGKSLLSGVAVEVYEALLFHFCNRKDGRCFPSLETIADHINRSKQAVVDAIKALTLHGFLIKTRRLQRKGILRTSAITGELEQITTTVQASNVYAFPPLAKAGALLASAMNRVKKVVATGQKDKKPTDDECLLSRIRGLAGGEVGKSECISKQGVA